jgi:cell division protease FtsH
VIFGHLSTGAANDLSKVTEIARSMVMRYGMVKSLGHVAYENEPTGFLNNNISQKTFSEATAREIDVAVREIVDRAYAKALAILKRERPALERWSQKLLDKETLIEADLDELRAAVAPEQRAAA